jgi:hypothetical protein
MWRSTGVAFSIFIAGMVFVMSSRGSKVPLRAGRSSNAATDKFSKTVPKNLPARAAVPTAARNFKTLPVDLSFNALLAEASSWTAWLSRLFPSDPQVPRAWEQCLANYKSAEPKCAKVLEVMSALLHWHKQNGQLTSEEAGFFAKLNLFECQREAALAGSRRQSCQISVDLIHESPLAAPVEAGFAELCRTKDPSVCFGAARFIEDGKLKNAYIRYGCQKGDAAACDSYAMTTTDAGPASERLMLNACRDGRQLGCQRVLAAVAGKDETQAEAAVAPVQDMVSQCVHGGNSSACQALVSAGFSQYLNPNTQSKVLNVSCSNLDLQSCVTLWQAQGVAQVQQISNRQALCAKYYDNLPSNIGSDEVCKDGFCYSQKTQKFFGQLCL